MVSFAYCFTNREVMKCIRRKKETLIGKIKVFFGVDKKLSTDSGKTSLHPRDRSEGRSPPEVTVFYAFLIWLCGII